MRTSIDFLLTNVANRNYGKSWQELDDKERSALEEFVVTRVGEDADYEYVKPKKGIVYGRYVEAGEDTAANRVARYIKDFVTEYNQFALDVGATISIPERKVEKECPVSALSQWNQEIQRWASEHNGEALEVAKVTCSELNRSAQQTSITEAEATPEKLLAHQKTLERKVFKAIAAGREAFGQTDGMVQHLLRTATQFKQNVKPGDSKYHICDLYLKAAEKAQKLVASIEKLNIDLKMNEYASLLEQFSELEQSVPNNEAIDGLPVVENEAQPSDPKVAERNKAEAELFAEFDKQVKELISQLPEDKERFNKGKELMLLALEAAHGKVKSRVRRVCEQLINAQAEDERRENRTIPTPVSKILDELAKRSWVDARTQTKTDPRSLDYLNESKITRFDELSESLMKDLLGKAAALYREDKDSPAVYSFDNVGFGLQRVKGADQLAKSIQSQVGGAINEMNALADAAGFEEKIPLLKEKDCYLVSDLVAENDRLATWAREHPYLMDLQELEGGLSRLAARKSSDPGTARWVQTAIDEQLNKVIIACVDGHGNAVNMLHRLSARAVAQQKEVNKLAKPSCEYVTRKAGLLAESMKRLQEMQTAKNAVLPDLNGEQFVAVIASLDPWAEYSADNTATIDELNRLYFKTAQALCESGVEFADVPSVISTYSSGALTTAKSRMQQLSRCMTQSVTVKGGLEKQFEAAREFVSSMHSISSSFDSKSINNQKVDQAIINGVGACQAFGMDLAEALNFLHKGLIGGELGASGRVLEYLDLVTAIGKNSEAKRPDKPDDVRNIVEVFDQLKPLETDTDSREVFDRSFSKAVNLLTAFGISVESAGSLIYNHRRSKASDDRDDLMKGVVDTLAVVPHSEPVTEKYIGVVRRCSPHIESLRKAGKDIKRFDEAKKAIDSFASVIIKSPEAANLNEALKELDQWIKKESAKGTLFQASGSSFAKLTGFAESYETKLKVAIEYTKTLCSEFDSKLEALSDEGNDHQFGLGRWLARKQLPEQLAEAFIHRARAHRNESYVVFPENSRREEAAEVSAPAEESLDGGDEYLSADEDDGNSGPIAADETKEAAPSSGPDDEENLPPPPDYLLNPEQDDAESPLAQPVPADVTVPSPPPPPPAVAPPPPPPPPPTAAGGRVQAGPTNATQSRSDDTVQTSGSRLSPSLLSGAKLRKTRDEAGNLLPVGVKKSEPGKEKAAPRDDLLNAIQKGAKLKKSADEPKRSEVLTEAEEKELNNKKRQAAKKNA